MTRDVTFTLEDPRITSVSISDVGPTRGAFEAVRLAAGYEILLDTGEVFSDPTGRVNHIAFMEYDSLDARELVIQLPEELGDYVREITAYIYEQIRGREGL